MTHEGDDTVTGSHGDDWIDGGSGNDTITTGAGNDTIVVYSDGLDVISDFSSTDKLDLGTYNIVTGYGASNYLEQTDHSQTLTSDHQVLWYVGSQQTGLDAINDILTSDGTVDEVLASSGLLLVANNNNDADGYLWQGAANEGDSYSGTLTQILTLTDINTLDDLGSGQFA